MLAHLKQAMGGMATHYMQPNSFGGLNKTDWNKHSASPILDFSSLNYEVITFVS
jgi:hypothetical protein